MTYSLNTKADFKSFSVPNDIVDRHLRLATGEQIKVLLLILRKAPKALDEAAIAKQLKYSISDVEDYLQYWVLMGVLKSDDDEEDEKEDFPVKFVPQNTSPAAKPVKEEVTTEYTKPSGSEIATRIGESKEIANLFKELQSKLGKTIGYDGQCTFLLLYDYFGLPLQVIFMLVDYCVSIGKTGYSYIEKVGKSWSEQEIDSIEKAADKITALNSAETFWKKFASAAGISTPKPTSKQVTFIVRWIHEWKMSFELIYLAYEKMADNTGKLSFAYMDPILKEWHDKGYTTPDDVEAAQKAVADAGKAKAGGNRQVSYDIDRFSQQSIQGKLKYERKRT